MVACGAPPGGGGGGGGGGGNGGGGSPGSNQPWPGNSQNTRGPTGIPTLGPGCEILMSGQVWCPPIGVDWALVGISVPPAAVVYTLATAQAPQAQVPQEANPKQLSGNWPPWPFQPRWWPSTDPSSCSVYAAGSLPRWVCANAGNNPRSNSIRGCLQQGYIPGYGYLPLLAWLPNANLSSLEGLDRRLGFVEHAYCIPEGVLNN